MFCTAMGNDRMGASIIRSSIRSRSKGEPRRLARYLAVSLISTGVDFAMLILLKSLGLSVLAANPLAYAAGFLVSFALNYRWTFSELHSKHVSLHFAQFLTVGICGLLLNTALVPLFGSLMGHFITESSRAYIPAKLLASVIVLTWNFNANRLDLQGQRLETRAIVVK